MKSGLHGSLLVKFSQECPLWTEGWGEGVGERGRSVDGRERGRSVHGRGERGGEDGRVGEWAG